MSVFIGCFHSTAIARSLLDKAPIARSGVLSPALSFLELYRDPNHRRNTETNDFTISELMYYKLR